MVLKDTIRLLLDGVGRSDEYEFYLRKFQSDKSACFSVFVPDCDALESTSGVLAANLQFLLKLELSPAVLLSGPRREWMLSQLLAQLAAGDSAEIFRLMPDSSADLLRAAADRARGAGRFLVIVVDDVLLSALRRVCAVLCRRLLFLRTHGLLQDRSGAGISLYRIRRDEPPLGPGGHGLRSLALGLYDDGVASHVAVAAPSGMLKEIFTVKGAGTILRPGSEIHRFVGPGGIDQERLRLLLRESFGREPARRDLIVPGGEVYLEANYRAAIVLEPHKAGFYLSKFSVGVQARGEGTAQELWEAAVADHAQLFWRARQANPIARWYNKLADGRHCSEGWYVFWRGVLPEHIPELIRFCLSRGDDFL